MPRTRARLRLERLEDRRQPAGLIAVGTDVGGGPHVKGFDAGTHAEEFSFYAYEPSVTGGVRVAVGDVNGDKVPDIITGAGPGGTAHVKVFSGVDLTLLHSFVAYDPLFTGGLFVGAADVDGDGVKEIITGAGAGGGPHVKVFDPITMAQSTTGAKEVRSFYAYDPSFTGGVSVAGGDVNFDHIDDILTGARSGGGPHTKAFDGKTGAELLSFFAMDPSFAGGINVASLDTNGDGKAEVVTGPGVGGVGNLRVTRAVDNQLISSFLAFEPSYQGGLRVGAVDIITGTAEGGGIRPVVLTGEVGGPGNVGVEPKVTIFDPVSHQKLSEFLAYDPSYRGGIFVAGGD